MNIFNTLILCGCIQGFVLSWIIYDSRAKNKWAYTYLAIFLSTFALSSIYHIIIDIGWNKNYPSLYTLPVSWNMLTPVALYFFVQHLSWPGRPFYKKDLLLCIPFGIQMLIEIPIFFTALMSPNFLTNYFEQINLYYFIETILATAYALALLIALVLKLRQYQKTLKDNYSNINLYSLYWLQKLLIAMVIIWLLWTLPVIVGSIMQVATPFWDYGFWIAMAILIYWIGYSTFTKRTIFETVPKVPIEKSSNSLLSQNAERHHQRLLEVMEQDQFFKKPDLNLEMLAAALDISSSYLSQIINKKAGQSFYAFVNEFRVEYAKQLLKDPQFAHLSVDGICYEAGFKSRSTFYAFFKKMTGQSPAQYRKGQN